MSRLIAQSSRLLTLLRSIRSPPSSSAPPLQERDYRARPDSNDSHTKLKLAVYAYTTQITYTHFATRVKALNRREPTRVQSKGQIDAALRKAFLGVDGGPVTDSSSARSDSAATKAEEWKRLMDESKEYWDAEAAAKANGSR